MKGGAGIARGSVGGRALFTEIYPSLPILTFSDRRRQYSHLGTSLLTFALLLSGALVFNSCGRAIAAG